MPASLSALFRRLGKALSSFARTTDGATAVEFAMIAAPFLATLIAILEVAIFLFAQQVLQNAAVEAGRLFMTGSAQNGNTTQTQFENDVCPMISVIFTCSSLMVNVQSASSNSSVTTGAPTLTFNAQGQVTNSWTFDPGTPGEIMVVQLIYMWPIVSGPFGYVISSLGNGKAEIMGVSAFVVEPY